MKPKHFRRRGVSALLSLTLALSSVAAPAFAEDGGESVEGLRFERAEKNYAVTASPLKPPDTVEIRVKLDPGVNARQIIMNNYSTGSEKSWGIEVTA
ncbi:MAG: hypothetical protein LBP30_01970, partial [Clostridiales Family XIII bacterium]|nr:hypothetical protein [Clostridiales Family XIII bacterium]